MCSLGRVRFKKQNRILGGTAANLVDIDVEEVEALRDGVGRQRLAKLLQLDEVVLQQLVRQLLRFLRRNHHLRRTHRVIKTWKLAEEPILNKEAKADASKAKFVLMSLKTWLIS